MFVTLTLKEGELALQSCAVIKTTGRASIPVLQRRMRISYTAAAKAINLLKETGVIGPSSGAEPRQIYADKLEEALGIASTSDPDGLLPIQTPSANDRTIDCPLCGGRILLSMIVLGANTCPHCRRIFVAE